MRLLIISDAPWTVSGYGNQVKQLGRAWQGLGHEVGVLCSYGLQGSVLTWEGMTCYPGGALPFGQDQVQPVAQRFAADLVITLKDVWVYLDWIAPRGGWGAGVRWCPMIPVDHDPAPPQVVQAARLAWQPIAYAQYGVKALRDAGLDPAYAPHSIDSALLSPMSQAEARAALGLPADRFVVATVAVNRGGVPSRKAWVENLEGFARFAAERPDAVLVAHTQTGEGGEDQAINLPHYLAQLGIRDRVVFPDQAQYRVGLPDAYMRALYSAADVVNCVSMGEGFGIPTLEAQACGTPVIIGDWCASSELLFAGWGIERRDAHRFATGQYAYQYLPHPAAIEAALGAAYGAMRDPARAGALRQAARAGALSYDTDAVAQAHWRPLLGRLAGRIASEHSRGVLRVLPAAAVVPQEVAA